MNKSYLTNLPLDFIRGQANFKKAGTIEFSRAAKDPSRHLCLQIYPLLVDLELLCSEFDPIENQASACLMTAHTTQNMHTPCTSNEMVPL